MPSPIVDRAAQHGIDTYVTTPSSTGRNRDTNPLYGPDPSIHMLGEPKSYPQLGRWLVLAILVGAVAAFVLVAITGS